jgi:hypothetical protein
MPMLVPMNPWSNSWELKDDMMEENEKLIDKIGLLELEEMF